MNSESNEDFYLSDIHVESVPTNSSNGLKMSRIEFGLPNEDSLKIEQPLSVDSDGDFQIQRHKSNNEIFLIEHEMQTILNNVGLQLWRACFFMSDFILNNKMLFNDKIVLDLGAGLGITSFTASLFASTVLCTDQEFVVKQAKKNYELNKETLKRLNPDHKILLKSLTWSHDESELYSKEDNHGNEFQVNDADLELIKNATVLIAADVIYDDLITIKLMNTIYKLMSCNLDKLPKCVYIANERRVNFNVEDLSARDTAFDYFKQCLNELDGYTDEEHRFQFNTSQLIECASMKQFINNYNRNQYLSIWKIECKLF